MVLGSFVSIKTLTSSMGAAAYGQLGLGMTIAGLLNQFIYAPLSQAAFRFYSVYRERAALPTYLHVLKRMYLVLAIFVVFFCGASMAVVHTWFGAEWAWLTVAALLFGLTSGANSFFLTLNTARRIRKLVALHEGADAWLRMAGALIGLYFFGNHGYIALTGYLAGTLVVTTSQAIFFSLIA